ncbi:thiosulfate oxidation carrier complex protein SoxZ [Ferrovibrio sp.]|uniref:thiosulfate oxidation carrier complex protein SoxZ n=1 Tax=Ferrovibrio sp. TaxID=1917215 RepID=UPI003D2D13E1
MARALINFPRNVKKGEVFEIRTLVSHPMETGYRPGPDGQVAPRDIIRRFTCHYGSEVVFRAEMHQAIAANPFISFTTVATESAMLSFTWEGDNGFSQTEAIAITVT